MIKSNFDFMVSYLEHGDYVITALFQPFRHKSLPTGRDILWNKGEGETRRKQSFYRDAMVELLGVAIIKTDATNHDDNGRTANNPENDLARYKIINYIFRHTDVWPKIYS